MLVLEIESIKQNVKKILRIYTEQPLFLSRFFKIFTVEKRIYSLDTNHKICSIVYSTTNKDCVNSEIREMLKMS